MRSYLGKVVLALGPTELLCIVVESPDQQAQGLQGRAYLLDSEGMYFPMALPGLAEFVMGGVTFPIDIIFFRAGRVAKIVGNIPPGHQGRWSLTDCSGVLEVRGGWARDHVLQLGTPLIASTGAWEG